MVFIYRKTYFIYPPLPHLHVLIETISNSVVVFFFTYESNRFTDVNNNKWFIVACLKSYSYCYDIFGLRAGGTADADTFMTVQYLLKNYWARYRWPSDKNDEESAGGIAKISRIVKTTAKRRGLYEKSGYRRLCHTDVMGMETNRLRRGNRL